MSHDSVSPVVRAGDLELEGARVVAWFLCRRPEPTRFRLELRAQCTDGRTRTMRGSVSDFRQLRDTIGILLECELDGRSLDQ